MLSLSLSLAAASGCVVAEEESEGDSSDWSPEYSEWILQHAIAKSVLELNALGQLDETEEGLVAWAEALVQMSQHSDDVNGQTSLGGSSEGMGICRRVGLIGLAVLLIRTYLVCRRSESYRNDSER